MKMDIHARVHAHAIELLLPVALRDFVVHEHHAFEIERLSPTHDNLPVNEPVVDPDQVNAHVPRPDSRSRVLLRSLTTPGWPPRDDRQRPRLQSSHSLSS